MEAGGSLGFLVGLVGFTGFLGFIGLIRRFMGAYKKVYSCGSYGYAAMVITIPCPDEPPRTGYSSR